MQISDTAAWSFKAHWLAGLAALCRSQSNFILAEIRGSDNVCDYASQVLVWRDGRFSTIAELIQACEKHRYGGLVYEAWIWETANRVHDVIRTLNSTAARAMRLVAERYDYYTIDTSAMYAALDYARACLEGTLTPEIEDRCFGFYGVDQ